MLQDINSMNTVSVSTDLRAALQVVLVSQDSTADPYSIIRSFDLIITLLHLMFIQE